MANYVVKDFEFIRGTTPRLGFMFRRVTSDEGVLPVTYEALVFDDVRFSMWTGATKNGALIARYAMSTDDIVLTDPDNGGVEFTMRAADTRALAQSEIGADAKNRYEIELRNGTDERVYVLGKIAGIGGANDDEEGIS